MNGLVLVVDPDPVVERFLSERLEPDGCEVLGIHTADESFNIAASRHPNLILLSADLANGIATCNQLKTQAGLREIPVILMSDGAQAEQLSMHRRLDTRADYYLQKPLTQQFVDRIRRLLRTQTSPPPLPPDGDELCKEDANLGFEEVGFEEVGFDESSGSLDVHESSENLPEKTSSAAAGLWPGMARVHQIVHRLRRISTEVARRQAKTIAHLELGDQYRKAQLVESMSDIARLEAEKTKLTVLLDRVSDRVDSLGVVCNKLSTERDNLRDQLSGAESALRTSAARVDESRTTIGELQFELQEVRSGLDASARSLESEVARADQLEADLNAHANELVASTGVVHRLRDELSERDDALSQLRRENAGWIQQLHRLEAELGQARDEQQRAEVLVAEAQSERERVHSEARVQRDEAQTELAVVVARAERARSEVGELRVEAERQEAANLIRLEQAQEETRAADEARERAEADKLALEFQVARLEEEATDAQAAKARLSELDESLRGLQAELQSSQESRRTVEQDLQELQSRFVEVSTSGEGLREEIRGLRNEVERSREVAKADSVALAQSEARRQEYESESSAAVEKVRALEAAAELLKQERDTDRVTHEEAQLQLAELKAELAVRETAGELTEMREQLRMSSTALERAQETEEALRSQLREREEEVGSVREAADKARSGLAQARAMIDLPATIQLEQARVREVRLRKAVEEAVGARDAALSKVAMRVTDTPLAPPPLPSGLGDEQSSPPVSATELQELIDEVTQHREALDEDRNAWRAVQGSVGSCVARILVAAASIPELKSGEANVYELLGGLKTALDRGQEILDRGIHFAEEQARRAERLRDSRDE